MQWLKSLLRKPEIKNVKKKILTTESLRAKIKNLGWNLIEIPIKKGTVINRWKVIAVKNERSIEMNNDTLDLALIDMSKFLGAISSNE